MVLSTKAGHFKLCGLYGQVPWTLGDAEAWKKNT